MSLFWCPTCKSLTGPTHVCAKCGNPNCEYAQLRDVKQLADHIRLVLPEKYLTPVASMDTRRAEVTRAINDLLLVKNATGVSAEEVAEVIFKIASPVAAADEAGKPEHVAVSLLRAVTGSLGLIIKGARADAVGHAVNYENAKAYLRGVGDSYLDSSPRPSAKEQPIAGAQSNLLIHAAELLEEEAECLRQSHTHPDTGDWHGEEAAQKSFDDMWATAQLLRAAASTPPVRGEAEAKVTEEDRTCVRAVLAEYEAPSGVGAIPRCAERIAQHRAKSSAAAVEAARCDWQSKLDIAEHELGWAHIRLFEAGYQDRVKIGEDLNGNEDFMRVSLRARVEAAIKDRDDARKERDRLAEVAAERLESTTASRREATTLRQQLADARKAMETCAKFLDEMQATDWMESSDITARTFQPPLDAIRAALAPKEEKS